MADQATIKRKPGAKGGKAERSPAKAAGSPAPSKRRHLKPAASKGPSPKKAINTNGEQRRMRPKSDLENRTSAASVINIDKQRNAMLRMIYVLGAVVLLMSAINLTLAFRTPEQKVVAMTETGKLISLDTVTAVIPPNSTVTGWAALKIVDSFTFNFANIDGRLNEIKPTFTAAGYNGFLNALDQQGIIRTIKQSRTVLNAIPNGPAVIVGEGQVGNHYAWRVEMPVRLTFTSADANTPKAFIVEALVYQTDYVESPDGLAIHQITTR